MLIPLGAVSSQAVQPKSGDRIRLTTTVNALDNRTGRVLTIRSDSLLLQVAPAETLAVALAGVTRLEVSTGRRRYALRGAGLGSLIGGASGAVIGYASGDDRGWCCFSAGGKAVIYGVGLGVTGLVIGTVVGALHVSDRWTSVPLGSAVATPRLQVGRRGTGIAVAVSF
jgi:hypothetical protein